MKITQEMFCYLKYDDLKKILFILKPHLIAVFLYTKYRKYDIITSITNVGANMFYRYMIVKDGQKSGLFHPKQKWNVQKENGLYDVVRKNFSDLPYIKDSKIKTISWFKQAGIEKFQNGIEQLKQFYSQYDIKVICIEKENIDNIISQDEYQVWCKH